MIFNMVGGGGGSGATLVVSSPANVSVTVSKDDKSYTKNSGSLGSTTFKGLATGTWTVTISGNGQTATKTIEITADYAITIAFFSASINITYPATSTCVVTNSSGQTVASNTNTGSSTKTWTATVGATGTYTVTATATDGSEKNKSATVNITTDGQSESVTLTYELVLYRAGDENTAVTGGWNAYPQGINASYPTGSLAIINLNKGTDKMTATVTNMGQYGCIVRHEKAVDLTPYKSIKFKGSVDANGATSSYVNFVCWSPSIGNYFTDNVAAVKNLGGASWSELSLDISTINDVGFVGFSFFNCDATVNITEIYLE